MSAVLQDLVQRRDQALRDLLELDQQAARGELSAEAAGTLRRVYQQEAAAAIAAIDRLSDGPDPAADDDPGAAEHGGPPGVDAAADGPGARPRRSPLQGRYALYALGFLSVVAAGLLLPGYLLDRPEGGFVSGNEALQQPGSADPGSGSPTSEANLENVTNEEMEAVVEANPEVIGMRLALADRYAAEGSYDLALVHYRKALEQDPGNAATTARLGWLMLQIGEADEADRLVDEALAKDPELLEGLWFKANVLLYGLDEPEAAVAVLDRMRERQDLSAEVRAQVEQLRQAATDLAAEGTR